MRTMYDSVNWRAIPVTASMVAGYIDSVHYTWPAAAWDRFPHAIKVRIATRATTNDGHVLDVETGDATPGQVPGWLRMRRAAGADPTVYCNVATWPAVQAACRAAGVAQPHYWIAHYDGSPVIPAGAVAKQYHDPPASGGDWDISAVADVWPGVDDTGGIDVTPEQDAILRDIREQLCGLGSRNPGQYTGWPQLGHKTIVDGMAVIGDNSDKYAAANAAALAAIQKAVGGLPTTNPGLTDAQVQNLATAVAAAIGSHASATPADIAAAVVTEFGARFPGGTTTGSGGDSTS